MTRDAIAAREAGPVRDLDGERFRLPKNPMQDLDAKNTWAPLTCFGVAGVLGATRCLIVMIALHPNPCRAAE